MNTEKSAFSRVYLRLPSLNSFLSTKIIHDFSKIAAIKVNMYDITNKLSRLGISRARIWPP